MILLIHRNLQCSTSVTVSPNLNETACSNDCLNIDLGLHYNFVSHLRCGRAPVALILRPKHIPPLQAMPRPQSSLTFRLALETFEDVKTQLVGLTEEAKTITQAVDNLKSTVQKKRKEVQRLVKTMAGKRKSLRALEKKSGKPGWY